MKLNGSLCEINGKTGNKLQNPSNVFSKYRVNKYFGDAQIS